MRKIYQMTLAACLASLLTWSGGLMGQQRMQYSQYLWNGFLMNPALAGIEDYVDLRSGYSHQWAGFEGAPRGLYLTGHGAIKPKARVEASEVLTSLPTPGRGRYNPTSIVERTTPIAEADPAFKMGLGGNVYAERTGPLSYNGIGASFSSNLRLKDELRLAIGVNLELMNYRFDPNKVTLSDGNDPAVLGTASSFILPSINAGFALYSQRFFLAASSRQLLQNRIQINPANPTISGLEVHYWMQGGLRLQVADNLELIPSAAFRFISPAPASMDLSLQAHIKDFLILGASYRHKDALVALVGLHLNNTLTLNYSYDYTTSALSNVSAGSHGISLGLRLGNKGATERRYFW